MSSHPYLTLEERQIIENLLKSGISPFRISKHLKRDDGGIYREIAKNGGKENYTAIDAHQRAHRPRKYKCKNFQQEKNKQFQIYSSFSEINEKIESLQQQMDIILDYIQRSQND